MYLVSLFFFTKTTDAQVSPSWMQHRIQYERMHFTQYAGKRFTLYVERNADRLDSVLLLHSSALMREIEDSLQLEFKSPLHLIVYTSPLHSSQRNIGLEFEHQNPGGVFEFHGNRIVLDYKGDIATFLIDLRIELIRALVKQAIYGSTAQEILGTLERNEVPNWFVEAMVQYMAVGFLPEDDNRMQYLLLSKRKVSFEECLSIDATLTGKAMFYYLEQRYGRNSLRQFLFLLRSTSNIDKASKRLYKLNFDQLGINMLSFSAAQGIQDQTHFDTVAANAFRMALPSIGYERQSIKSLINQNAVVYLRSSKGEYEVVFQPFSKTENQARVILRIKSDVRYPTKPLLFEQQDSPSKLGVIYARQGKLYAEIMRLNAKGELQQRKKYPLDDLEHVAHAQIGQDGNTLYFVAGKEARTELYSLSLRTSKLKQLSNNNLDELALVEGVHQGVNGLYYTVRNVDSFRNSSTEIRFMPMSAEEEKPEINPWVIKLTNSSDEVIRDIYYPTDGWVYYLSDRNGVMNLWRFLPAMNSPQGSEQLTSFDYSISSFAMEGSNVSLCFLHHDSMVVSQVRLDSLISQSIVNTSLRNILHAKQEFIRKQGEKQSIQDGKDDGYSFFKPSEKTLKEHEEERRKEQTLDTDKLKPYALQLTSEYVSAQLDNTLLVNTYQPYAQNQGQFKQVPLGGMMRYAFTDLFEDYRAEIGFRIPSFTKGSDFFMQIDHRRDRLDWRFSYLRHSEKSTLRPDSNWQKNWTQFKPSNYKQVLHYAELGLSYPISIRSHIQFSTGMRYDKQYFLALDTFSLRYPDTSQIWSLAKLVYSHDRTRLLQDVGRLGLRVNLFLEFHYQLSQVQTGFNHVGFDIRYYKRLFKQSVLASKLSAAASAGETNGIMYVLGGTSNWLGPRIDSNAAFLPSDNYSFTTYATSLRGSPQNVRYGNIYLLLNTEYRIPLRSTFNLPKTRLNAIDNLKVVPFFDFGNAWRSNATSVKPSWIFGYGIGLHSTLLSYHVRFDLAWSSPMHPTSRYPMLVVGLGNEF